MATVSLNGAAAAAGTIHRGLRALLPVHMRVNHADLEQALPLQNMQPVSEGRDGLRLRQTSANPQSQGESSSTSRTLTPSSLAASSKIEGKYLQG
jgi:hypothetical protein